MQLEGAAEEGRSDSVQGVWASGAVQRADEEVRICYFLVVWRFGGFGAVFGLRSEEIGAGGCGLGSGGGGMEKWEINLKS